MRCKSCDRELPEKYCKKSDGSDEDLCRTCLNDVKFIMYGFDEEQTFNLPEGSFIDYD